MAKARGREGTEGSRDQGIKAGAAKNGAAPVGAADGGGGGVRCNGWCCPSCNHASCPRTGSYAGKRELYRYRKCAACGYGFTTRQPLDHVSNRTTGKEELVNETRRPRGA